jgi:5-methylcytosine-specific restriction endonuclease McrA
MATKIGCKRTTPRKPLQRKPIKKISSKQAKRNKELANIPPPLDGRCQNCGNLPDFRGLAKHHLIFRSHGGKDTGDNLIWVCGRCHSRFHGIIEC